MSSLYANNQLHPWEMPMESQAKAYHDILEAIFDYANDNFEPKGLGLMTKEKEIAMLEKTGQQGSAQCLYLHPCVCSYSISILMLYMTVCSKVPALVLTQQYVIMGCAFQMLAGYDPNASPYDFREPDQPGLTKHGWIKFQVISALYEGNSVRILRVFSIERLHLTSQPQRRIPTTKFSSLTLPLSTYRSKTPTKEPFSLREGTHLFQEFRLYSGTQGLSRQHSTYEISREFNKTYRLG